MENVVSPVRLSKLYTPVAGCASLFFNPSATFFPRRTKRRYPTVPPLGNPAYSGRIRGWSESLLAGLFLASLERLDELLLLDGVERKLFNLLEHSKLQLGHVHAASVFDILR